MRGKSRLAFSAMGPSGRVGFRASPMAAMTGEGFNKQFIFRENATLIFQWSSLR
jgi:hypothetical protein